jgi:NifB/MoaA-like Fe-S oxidoreductase
MHTQVVLCPDLNDAAELERTVDELVALYPAVRSLAVVPLGLTAHRRALPHLLTVDAGYARGVIAKWQPFAERLRRKLGQPFLHLADEFYLKAALPFPQIKEYGDFPQIENGVGMVPLFKREASRLLRRIRRIGTFRATVITGVSSLGFVTDFLMQLAEKSGVDIIPLAVENRLFGASITVTGLIAGNDIVTALTGHNIGACLLLPDVMLKEGEGIFLDDVSLSELEERISCPVLLFDSTPVGCYNALRSFGKKLPRNK